MSKYRNAYEVLGLTQSASDDDIKKAFRKLVKKYHPDICKEKNATEKMQDINEAYESIGDPKKRKEYDAYLNSGYSGSNSYSEYQQSQAHQHSYGGYGGEQFFQGGSFQQWGFNDIFRNLFNDGGNNHHFGNEGFSGESGHSNAKEYNYSIDVNIRDWFKGSSMTIEYDCFNKCMKCSRIKSKCHKCNGKGYRGGFLMGKIKCSCSDGYITQLQLCGYCHQGRVRGQRKSVVKLSPQSDLSVVVKGGGDYSIYNDCNDDLVIGINIINNTEYKIEKSKNVVISVDVGIEEFLLGQKIQFRYLDGLLYQFTIHPCKYSSFVFNNKGIKHNNQGRMLRGDLIVRLSIINNVKDKSNFKDMISQLSFNKVQDNIFSRT